MLWVQFISLIFLCHLKESFHLFLLSLYYFIFYFFRILNLLIIASYHIPFAFRNHLQFFYFVFQGYGIVRPKLMSAEWIAVAVVSVLYFTGGKARKIFIILSQICYNLFCPIYTKYKKYFVLCFFG